MGNYAISKSSVIPVLVTEIQPAQVFGLKGFFDPTDVGSLDPRHKGEDDGEWGVTLARQSISVSVNNLSASHKALPHVPQKVFSTSSEGAGGAE